jgi:replication initiation protein RepC
MTMESAVQASGGSYAGAPTGFRRLTPGLLRVDRVAEGFDGLPDGVTMHGQLLAAFKAAAPRLGFSPRMAHAIDWLFKFTMAQDWGRGGRPIVWPSASFQQESLGLSPTRTKVLNRALIEAGLVTMRDSPNGKRYGKRDPKGRIIEAYGFDLSPIAERHAEFVRLAAEAKAEREEMRRMRRRATIARNGITQILETAAEYGFAGEEWLTLRRESRNLALALRKVERPEEMALGVESLERRQISARERLEFLLAEVAARASESVNPDPLGAENGPHQYTYKPGLHPQEDTVIAPEESSRAGGEAGEPHPTPGPLETLAAPPVAPVARPEPPPETGRVLKLHPDELVRLAPKLKAYLRRPDPTWAELVDAAAFLRADLDVSKSLWGEACLVLGREKAAVAIAIVSAKDPEHFRTTAGGYFHGMVAKAKAGELNLDRTLWGMRRANDPRPPGKTGSSAGGGGRPAAPARSWN